MRELERIQELEDLITNQLLPIYKRYYELTQQPMPELDLLFKSPQVPALFKPKAGLRSFPRTS